MSPARSSTPRHARSSGRRRPARSSARHVALDALERIDADGAYANLVVPKLLERSDLSPRDRRFVTELVYGTTRMRRACDFVVDRFLSRPPVSRVRNALRLGAYQLVFAEVPAHAAVAETVAVSPRPARGLVNAVLRRVAREGSSIEWPDDATRLSVPDWVPARLAADLGTERADGYIQDRASQQVAAAVGAQPGELVLDACAAPGGKTTALAEQGALVVAADVRPGRLGLVRRNAERLAVTDQVALVAADGRQPPWRAGGFDRVLLDAPCSGLGTLRRRPDLRWRVEERAVERLSRLQRELVTASVPLVRPGGILVYSVCTLTRAESTGIDDLVAAEHPELEPVAPPGAPWEPWGRGAILVPQAAGTDGMCLFRYRRVEG